jgi:cell wall surface anchor family protein
VAYDNPITKLNVNNDIALKDLYLQNVNTNALSGNVVTITGYDQAETLELAFAGTEFTTLNLTGSSVLTSFNIDENIQLTKLVASGNSLVTGVNVSTLTALTHLDLNACGLTDLNVDSNVELQYFDCSSNKLTALNVNNNASLTMFDCSDNQLSTIRVVNNTALDKLDVSKNNLLNVNVRSNTVLKTLNVSDNTGITALALGYNTGLETLEASNTALTDIDLSNNLEIANLNLAGCSSMHILDVSKNVALSMLNYNGCKIDATGLKIGAFVVAADVPGVVFYSSGSVVKIVSKDETKSKWGIYGITTNANSNTDGASNTDKIVAKSPAAQWCRAKGASWYLPALDELKAVYNNKSKLNATLSSSSVEGTQFGTNYYWSSTEDDIDYFAYYVGFSSGNTDYYNKDNTYCVRAVRVL